MAISSRLRAACKGLSREQFDNAEEWWDDYYLYSAFASEVPDELAVALKKSRFLIEMIKRTANGRSTAAEALGHREFVMTKLYRSA